MAQRCEIAVELVPEADPYDRRVRTDIALAYRLIRHFGLDDLTDGFVSGRVAPGSDDIIIGGYGVLPQLVTASRLHRRQLSAPVKLQKKGGVDVDAMRFSQIVYASKPGANACIHAHPFYAMLYACLDIDLLPMSQYGFMYRGKIGYVPFASGDVTSPAMGAAIAEALDGREAVILRNHGVLIPGTSVAHAVWVLYRLEQTCRLQIEALKAGAPIVIPPEAQAQAIQDSYWSETYIDNDGTREWDELARMMDRIDPSYRD